MIGDEEFDFDDEIVNSRAYRRIINRHRAPKDRSPSDDGVQGNVQEEDEYPEGEPTEILAGKGSRHIAHTGKVMEQGGIGHAGSATQHTTQPLNSPRGLTQKMKKVIFQPCPAF